MASNPNEPATIAEATRLLHFAHSKIGVQDWQAATQLCVASQNLCNSKACLMTMAIINVIQNAQRKFKIKTKNGDVEVGYWYKILQINDIHCSEFVIHEMHAKLVKLLDPKENKFFGAETALGLVNFAYKFLSDQKKRQEYNRLLQHVHVESQQSTQKDSQEKKESNAQKDSQKKKNDAESKNAQKDSQEKKDVEIKNTGKGADFKNTQQGAAAEFDNNQAKKAAELNEQDKRDAESENNRKDSQPRKDAEIKYTRKRSPRKKKEFHNNQKDNQAKKSAELNQQHNREGRDDTELKKNTTQQDNQEQGEYGEFSSGLRKNQSRYAKVMEDKMLNPFYGFLPFQDRNSPTYWTVCSNCHEQYEYERIHENKTMGCWNCRKPFVAVEAFKVPLKLFNMITPEEVGFRPEECDILRKNLMAEKIKVAKLQDASGSR